MSANQRVVLATVLSLGVFLAYDYFFMSQKTLSGPKNETKTELTGKSGTVVSEQKSIETVKK